MKRDNNGRDNWKKKTCNWPLQKLGQCDRASTGSEGVYEKIVNWPAEPFCRNEWMNEWMNTFLAIWRAAHTQNHINTCGKKTDFLLSPLCWRDADFTGVCLAIRAADVPASHWDWGKRMDGVNCVVLFIKSFLWHHIHFKTWCSHRHLRRIENISIRLLHHLRRALKEAWNPF